MFPATGSQKCREGAYKVQEEVVLGVADLNLVVRTEDFLQRDSSVGQWSLTFGTLINIGFCCTECGAL